MENTLENAAPYNLPNLPYLEEASYGDFLITAAICAALILITVAVFYETMRYVWHQLNRIEHHPRLAIHIGVMSVFFCHTICVWLYGTVYWLLVEVLQFGSLHGQFEQGNLLSYIYFSVITYSTVGYGDIYASGPIRIMTGVEAVNGLILIGWSTTYTYFAAERYMARERALLAKEAKQEKQKVDLTEV